MIPLPLYIVTWCPSDDALYGCRSTLDTLRTGFPTASLRVLDNGSRSLKARDFFRGRTAELGGLYEQLQTSVSHAECLLALLGAETGKRAVVLDPDLIFWRSCEDWQFDTAIAGRYLPRFFDEYADAMTAERLHTSFLWFEDLPAIRATVTAARKRHFDFPVLEHFSFPTTSGWMRYDTGAALYALCRHQATHFGTAELDCYDHMFCGSHLERVAPKLSNGARLREIHGSVRAGDYEALRGIWREQEEHFAVRGGH